MSGSVIAGGRSVPSGERDPFTMTEPIYLSSLGTCSRSRANRKSSGLL